MLNLLHKKWRFFFGLYVKLSYFDIKSGIPNLNFLHDISKAWKRGIKKEKLKLRFMHSWPIMSPILSSNLHQHHQSRCFIHQAVFLHLFDNRSFKTCSLAVFNAFLTDNLCKSLNNRLPIWQSNCSWARRIVPMTCFEIRIPETAILFDERSN